MAEHANSIPAPRIPRPHATDERFDKWWAAAQACDAQIDAEGVTDEDVESLLLQKHGFEFHIASHVAVGPIGALVKARLLHRWLATDKDEFGSGLAVDIISHLDASR